MTEQLPSASEFLGRGTVLFPHRGHARVDLRCEGGRIERAAPASVTGPRGVRPALLLVGVGVLAAAPGVIWYFFVRGRAASAVSTAPSPCSSS